jgi:hypothetical protein
VGEKRPAVGRAFYCLTKVFSSAGDPSRSPPSLEHPSGMPSRRRDDRIRQKRGASTRHHRQLLDRAEAGQDLTDHGQTSVMRNSNMEPDPGHNHRGDYPEQEPLSRVPHPNHELSSRPSLTIAEAARLCGVSASTIRRALAAGRFPTAHQQPSPNPGQRELWRIPTWDLLAAGLRPRQAPIPVQEEKNEPSSRRTAGQPGDGRIRELEHALALERTRRRAAEDLAAERARTIQTLKTALRALQTHHAAPGRSHDPAALTGPRLLVHSL